MAKPKHSKKALTTSKAQKSPVVIITGANGFIGRELVQHFAAQGWQVRGLVRDVAAMDAQSNVEYFAYDLDQEPADAIFAGADYLVHTAYVKETRATPNAFELNVEGTKRLLAKSRAHTLQKNVFMSSMSAHDEALSAYGKQKLALEKLFTTRQDAIIRSGLVIGNGGLIQQIVKFMRGKHVAPVIGSGNQPIQIIGVYDLVQVISTILTKDLHGMFTIGTPQVYSYRELYQTLRRKFGIKVAIVPVPFWLPLLAIRTIAFLHLPLGVTEDNLQGLKKLKAFETLPDLQKIGLTLDDLDQVLEKVTIS